jgi:hypothetical protein
VTAGRTLTEAISSSSSWFEDGSCGVTGTGGGGAIEVSSISEGRSDGGGELAAIEVSSAKMINISEKRIRYLQAETSVPVAAG